MWPAIVGALAVLFGGTEPIPLPECVREFAAREVAFGKCLRVVADDAKYNRCLAALGQRPKERPKVRVCYGKLPLVCVRLLEHLHQLSVRCYKEPGPEETGSSEDPSKGERSALARAAKTCERLLEDEPRGDRALHACRRYNLHDKRRGTELVAALVSHQGMRAKASKDPREAVVRCSRFSEPQRVVAKFLEKLCDLGGGSGPDVPASEDIDDQDSAVGETARGLEWLGTAVKIIGVILALLLGAGLWRRYRNMERAMTEPTGSGEGGAPEPEQDPPDDERGPQHRV